MNVAKPTEIAFLKRFTKDGPVFNGSPCWVWKAGLKNGYGKFNLGNRGCWAYAHIFSYEKFKGPHQKGMHLDHLCRNKTCVNPEHLELVTPRTNILRGVGASAVNFKKTKCPKGHELPTAVNRKRRCLICRDTYNASYMQKYYRSRCA